MTSAAIVQNGFFLVEAGRRNRNFKVYLGNHPGLFIKQMKSTEPQAVATLQREAAFYHRLQESPSDEGLHHLVPSFVNYDPVRSVLVLELVPEAQSIVEHHSGNAQQLLTSSRSLGRALATLHTQLISIFGPSVRSLFPLQLPWVLMLDQTGYQGIQQFGPVGVQLASAMQRLPGFDLLLGSLRSLWQWETVIHGDMKWDNVLVSRKGSPEIPLWVVDWELVDFGDSAWDVASVLKEHVVYGLFTLFNAYSAAGQQLGGGVEAAMAGWASSANGFFQEYVSARSIPAMLLPAYAGRCIRFTAARMVMAVLEYLYTAPTATQMTDLMLQTALGFLQHPSHAAWNLMGAAAV